MDNSQQDEAPPSVVGHETSIRYADRSIRAVLIIGAMLFLIGLLTSLFLFKWDTLNINNRAKSTTHTSAEIVSNSKESKTSFLHKIGSSLFPDFFQNENSSNNIEVNDVIQAQIYLQQRADKVSRLEDGYRNSIYDTLNSRVVDMAGREIGHIHDIIVNAKTGTAQAVIVDANDHHTTQDLRDIDFSNVFKQTPSGYTKVTINEKNIEDTGSFKYSKFQKSHLISLRRLRAGQLLDYQGDLIGQVDAVIYGNAEVQGLVINLRPGLEPYGPDIFYLSFDQVHFIENLDGLDVHLNKAQTRALAKSFLN